MTSSDVVVAFDDVGKRFRRYDVNRAPTLKRFVLSGFRRTEAERFWALRHVSGEVTRGSTVGLIGRNGAGKSTLLRLLAGVGRADEGTISAHGRIGALLDLGKEFNPELSGRENAMAAGVVAGLTIKQVEAILPHVIEFSELGAFMDNPLRTYSAGMQARLAFGMAVHVRPDVLFIDEVLAVGDVAFQRRCIDKLHEFRREGVTIVLVSHDPRLVRALCDEVIWLRRGTVAARGLTDRVEAEYRETLSAETTELTPADAPPTFTARGVALTPRQNRFGSQEAVVTAVRIVNGWAEEIEELESGAELRLEIHGRVPPDVGAVNLAVQLRRGDVLCVDTSTPMRGGPDGGAGATLILSRLDLAPGIYTFDVGLYDESWEHTYDLHVGAYEVTVAGDAATAILTPPVIWKPDT